MDALDPAEIEIQRAKFAKMRTLQPAIKNNFAWQ